MSVILSDVLCLFFSANLDPAELKKLRSKQRKAAKKAEQNKAEEKKKEEKKAEHQKSKSGGNTVWLLLLCCGVELKFIIYYGF